MVHTDQKSLKFLLEQREVTIDYQKWMIKLLNYDFEIVYKPRMENRAAYGLSRMVQPSEVLESSVLIALTVPTELQLQDLYEEIDKDAKIQEFLQTCKVNPDS